MLTLAKGAGTFLSRGFRGAGYQSRRLAHVTVGDGGVVHLSAEPGEKRGVAPLWPCSLEISAVSNVISVSESDGNSVLLLTSNEGDVLPIPSSADGYDQVASSVRGAVNGPVGTTCWYQWSEGSFSDRSHLAGGSEPLFSCLLDNYSVHSLAAIETLTSGSRSALALEELAMVPMVVPRLLSSYEGRGGCDTSWVERGIASRVISALAKDETCAVHVATHAAALMKALGIAMEDNADPERKRARNLGGALASLLTRVDSRDRIHDSDCLGMVVETAEKMSGVTGVPQLTTLACACILGAAMDVRNHTGLLTAGAMDLTEKLAAAQDAGTPEHHMLALILQLFFENQTDEAQALLDGGQGVKSCRALVSKAPGDIRVQKATSSVLLNLCLDEGNADPDKLYEMILDNTDLDYLILELQRSPDVGVRQAIATVKEVYEALARVHAPLSTEDTDKS